MSPEMLTLVAAVLVYDLAMEMRDARSSTVDTEASPRLRGALESRSDRSWTRLEKDILPAAGGLAVKKGEDTATTCRPGAKVSRSEFETIRGPRINPWLMEGRMGCAGRWLTVLSNRVLHGQPATPPGPD